MSLLFISFLIALTSACSAEKIRYIATEHPAVSYFNTKYFSYFNLTSRRYGRSDPFYYVGLNFYALKPFGNNVTLDFYFYEFLTNRYRRGFLEMHFKLCDLVEKDDFFGTALRQGKFALPCPYPLGAYNLSNMTIPLNHIPHTFPITKGSIYFNISTTVSKELIASAHIDMEVKETHIRTKN